MKKILLPVSFVFVAFHGVAQKTVFSVGTVTSMTVKASTLFSADSLVLTPATDLLLSNNILTETATPVEIGANGTIKRVFNFANELTYTGDLQIYYNPATELNGNTEAGLVYIDSSSGGTWTKSMTSSVNTATHYVQQTLSAHPFLSASATSTIVTLPLSLIYFTGVWQGNSVPLQWAVDQENEGVNFTVYSSTDASSWQSIATVPGVPGNGLYTYDYTDFQPAGSPMYYRIGLDEASGAVIYSNIVVVHRPGAGDPNLRLVAEDHQVHVWFDNEQPAAIRIVNAGGQLIHVDPASRVRYDVYGLMSGVYFLQYHVENVWNTREFLIP